MKKITRLVTLTSTLTFPLLFVPDALSAPTNITYKPATIKTLPDRILVRFKPGTSAAKVAAAHGKSKPASEHAFTSLDGLKLFTLPPGLSVQDAIAHYKKNPNVLYVEQDFEVGLKSTNDTSYSQLWALNNTGQSVNGTSGTADVDMNIPEAWSNSGVTGSNSVVIAVIDSGVQYNHPDLQANMWVNPGEIASNGVDDDSNGYIDDVYGINAITNTGNPMDDNNHGTHVAGTIAAVGNNSTGITGVNQQAKILACKFLSASGSGASSDALKCLDYIYALKNKGINIVVSNNSWGGGGFSQSIADAIDSHRKAGILFVAAAGNDGTDNDASPHYPANYYKANVIAVAATDQNDALASFSDYGRRTVHVGAPGVNIYSTIPSNSYTYLQGTSMAAPHVTGLIALLSAQDATRDWRTLKNLVITSGKPIGALTTKSITGRRIRAYDTNGTGAMTCSNQTLAAAIYPQTTTSTKISGSQLGLAMLNINCASPAGTVNVTTTGPSAVSAVTLQDNGLGFDDVAGDGIYSGYWTAPATTGSYTLTFGSTGQTQTVTVMANTSTRTAYRAPVAITYNPRTEASASFTALPDNAYIAINGYSAYYNVLVGGTADATIYATPQGINLVSAPTGSQLSGANTTLPNDIFETAVAAYWDDIDISAAGNGIKAWAYYNPAATPVGEVVFEWKGVSRGTSTPVQFQIVYTANSSDIEMHYIATDNNAASATTGIQSDWVRATTQNYNVANTDLAAGKAWRWRLDNGVPTANAGTTQNVNGNALVTLSGSGSDPDGGTLHYLWTQTGGTTATLTGANTLTPTFYAPNVTGTLTFQLAVTDDANQTTTSSVSINVTAVASAGALALSAATYSVNETGGSAIITVTRSGGSTGTVGLTYATADGTASSSNDYTYTSGTLTWASGDAASKTISIPITNDAVSEANETLSILLTNATGGATLGTANGTITISETVPVPGTLGLSSATYTVNENVASATITVSRTGGTDGTVGISYTTTNGTATAGSDYTATSGTLSFANGETSKSFTISMIDDTAYEGDETVLLTLSSVSGGASLGTSSASLSIVENDSAPVAAPAPTPTPTPAPTPTPTPAPAPAPVVTATNFDVGAASYSVNENVAALDISINRTGSTTDAMTVDYATTNGTATSGADYAALSGTLNFASGDTTATVSITISDDAIYEGDENFTFTLSNPSTGATLGTASATVTIADNESAPVASNQAPEIPTLVSPADGSNGVNGNTVTFKWNSVTDPDGDTVSYELYYCTDASFTGCAPTQVSSIAIGTETLMAGLGGGTSLAMLGLVGTASRRRRIVNAVILVAVSIAMTACGANLPPLPIDNPSQTQSVSVTNLSAKTTYYWKVVATDSKGASSSSDTWSFTTL